MAISSFVHRNHNITLLTMSRVQVARLSHYHRLIYPIVSCEVETNAEPALSKWGDQGNARFAFFY